MHCIYNVYTMSKTIINIKTDSTTKENAKIIASEMGLTLSALINMQLKQLIRDRRLTLDVSSYPILQIDAKTAAELDAVHKEVEAGEVSQVFNNVDDFFQDLMRDD